jgi:hypothetical protein
MFATTKNRISMILGAVLFAGAALQTPASAASLAKNEHAAQAAIGGDLEDAAAVPGQSPAPNIAHSEALARCAISNASTPVVRRAATIVEATLTHNEIAAQRAIVDATASDGFGRYAASTTKSVASMRSPSTR